MYYYHAKIGKSLYRFAELPEIGVTGQVWHWTNQAWSQPDGTLAADVLFSGDYRQISEQEAKSLTREGDSR
jgi:hypothetical protein